MGVMGEGWRLSGGLGKRINDPIGGSGDVGSPVSEVVAERGERVSVVVMVLEGMCVCVCEEGESIWFGASRGSVLACSIPGAQHNGVSFQPPPPQTHHHATFCTPFFPPINSHY